MCGILGIASFTGAPSIDDRTAERMRDTLERRGPDGAGLWRSGPFLLAHRRLAIIDPTPAGSQPMVTPDGRYALTYNGELYNDAELRRELSAEGVRFTSACDAETILHALARWGAEAIPRLRGMFAIGFVDTHARTLLLARDALGVKPLCFAVLANEIVFASESRAILAHPAVSPAPDLISISAYLTTIRTSLAGRTMFEGVCSLPPGELMELDLSGHEPRADQRRWFTPTPVERICDDDAVDLVRDVMIGSVSAHLRSDVPLCALLSGGLDSTITSALAAREHEDLQTFCAGAHSDDDADDLACARRAAESLGTRHHEAVVDASSFVETWGWMVGELGVPLSTPNEVAIYTVARTLRDAGCVVTLSGEGADELFAGYESPMRSALRHASREMGSISGGRAQLAASAWMQPALKSAMLAPHVARELGDDEPIAEHYDALFNACRDEAGASASPMDAHLRCIERINLTGLLQRLDTATMLASVEGRTPYADLDVARLAHRLPIATKFDVDSEPAHAGGAVATATSVRTKIALRRAFDGLIPDEPRNRPKASFPLPFQSWLGAAAPEFRTSPFAREVFAPDAIEQVAANPVKHWKIAWPMMNLARWGDRWW